MILRPTLVNPSSPSSQSSETKSVTERGIINTPSPAPLSANVVITVLVLDCAVKARHSKGSFFETQKVTIKGLSEAKTRIMDYGADEFAVKPMSMESLINKVNMKLLEKS